MSTHEAFIREFRRLLETFPEDLSLKQWQYEYRNVIYFMGLKILERFAEDAVAPDPNRTGATMRVLEQRVAPATAASAPMPAPAPAALVPPPVVSPNAVGGPPPGHRPSGVVLGVACAALDLCPQPPPG